MYSGPWRLTPLLTFYSCLMGVLGGGIVGRTQLDVAWRAYMRNGLRFGENQDLYVGLLKAFIFGIIITIVACHEGFATTKGAVGVGKKRHRSAQLHSRISPRL